MTPLEFFIPGEFTTLNDFIAAAKRNRHEAATIKRVETARVAAEAREVPPVIKYPVDLHLTWYRSNRRSDPDNVYFAIKFVLDGLQVAKVIKQDTWACIAKITHECRIDRDNPGVAISITEAVENGK
jgi:Holliday junction resolvase RusA-like endonuclease